MATVYAGLASGSGGFARPVAIKRLRDDFLGDPEAIAMLLDEARLVARIQHPHVVSILDVVEHDGELLLIMEYVAGVSLAELVQAAAERDTPIPRSVALRIMTQVLGALDAAHTATGDNDEPLGIVHRDVSPQNILIGREGIARIADFGVAKAAGRVQTTSDGQLKGKLGYMAPEQVRGGHIDRRTDLYAAGVVAWELLTGRRLFTRDTPAETIHAITTEEPAAPSETVVGLPWDLDAIVLRSLAKDANNRPSSGPEMAKAIGATWELANETEVGAFVAHCCPELIRERSRLTRGYRSEVNAEQMPAGIAQRVAKATSAEEPTFIGSNRGIEDDSTSRHGIGRHWRLLIAASALAVITVLAIWFASGPDGATPEAAPSLAQPESAALPATPPKPAIVPAAGEKSITDPVRAVLERETKPRGKDEGPRASSSDADAAAADVPSKDRAVPPRVKPSPPPPASEPDCDPPYVVDSQGAKQYKLECL